MNGKRMVTTVVLIVAAGAAEARAAIITEHGRAEPYPAYVVSKTASQVVVDEVLSDGSLRRRQIATSRIQRIDVLVSNEKLASLDPAQPDAYREYAEDLYAKRHDPEARDAALRLFQIAAFLEPDRLGRSCLLGMARIARGDDERRRFLALAFLLDPRHDRGILEPASRTPGPSADDPDTRQLVLDVLRALRQADYRLAYNQARRDEFRQGLERFFPQISAEEVLAAGRSGKGPIAGDLLRRILNAEISELRRQLSARSPTPDPSWSAGVRLRIPAAVQPLSVESIVEFDPRQNRFRNGRWQ